MDCVKTEYIIKKKAHFLTINAVFGRMGQSVFLTFGEMGSIIGGTSWMKAGLGGHGVAL